jgi:hypothetical protein
LERFGSEESLEVGARRGVSPLDFDHSPRQSVARDQEVDLAAVLVTDVVQAEVFPPRRNSCRRVGPFRLFSIQLTKSQVFLLVD